ncbi:MAG TPA: hypothetical protein VN752_06855 [Solirubrobacterales bacterium]|nr:hypothetical protein [Solirubrobacterales bacterium]
MTAAGNGCLGADEYAELVAAVREAVAAALPGGASVLVVSKGDEALLDLPGVSAAHFPQAGDGGYAGHHPADGVEATRELEALRRAGAEYLVIPATARWWLDFYEELAQHLVDRAELAADIAGVCMVYALGPRQEVVSRAPIAAKPQAGPDQIRDYLERLFPAECELVVLEAEGGLAAALAPLHASALPLAEEPESRGDLLEDLGLGAAVEARYLVVPRSCDHWLRSHAWLEEQLDRELRKVADQRHLCRVFEITRQMEAA